MQFETTVMVGGLLAAQTILLPMSGTARAYHLIQSLSFRAVRS
ncbi:hypothetical protein CF161_10459 [Pseudomonas sp. CF161]|nr:hypothetical protein CF161_10459 [Pseudomonas sp. CF161]